ncbi:calcium:proton antiporter [uncultured Shewanella sp.]|uniref:calcium:proton antiporter n=1 Tax=uncultured Shewanella sp. TaxID=173975 RepID=UPI00261329AC|nr:calcium:proton antiporter [uncultured Shewanella sp.]
MRIIRQELATICCFLILVVFISLKDGLSPQNLGNTQSFFVLIIVFLIMLWCAFNVVRHAESLAVILGEPYGTLILTLSVILIEVALISSVMLTGADSPTLARDTMFSVLMIILNGLVGISLLLGGWRHKMQSYNVQGANAYLSVLIPLAILGLVMPSFTNSTLGGTLSPLLAISLGIAATVLYGVFLVIQTTTHSDIFQPPKHKRPHAISAKLNTHKLKVKTLSYHVVMLIAAILAIVFLSKILAVYIDHVIALSHAPVELGGFLIAAIILTPEGLSAVNAALANKLQRSVNICLGSALATIGLTIPAVLCVSWITTLPVELGLAPLESMLLVLTLMVSVVTFVSRRTNIMQGVVHLTLFAAYIVLIFDSV